MRPGGARTSDRRPSFTALSCVAFAVRARPRAAAAAVRRPQCTANCPDGEYSDVAGLDDKNDCKDCPPGYRGWQCTWELKPLNYDGVKEHAFDKDACVLLSPRATAPHRAAPRRAAPLATAAAPWLFG